MNWSALDVAEVPPEPVTVTSTVPALPAGDVAVICVALFTVKLVAAVAPNLTAVAPVKLGTDDVIVTLVPPATGPEFGLIAETTGTAAGAPDSSSRLALEDAPSVTCDMMCQTPLRLATESSIFLVTCDSSSEGAAPDWVIST